MATGGCRNFCRRLSAGCQRLQPEVRLSGCPDLPLPVQSTQVPTPLGKLTHLPVTRLEKDLLRLHDQTLPELFSDIEFLCSTASSRSGLKGQFDFRKVVDAFRVRLEEYLDAFQRHSYDPLLRQIEDFIPGWEREARDDFDTWRRMHGNTVNLFLHELLLKHTLTCYQVRCYINEKGT
jgi:hypothetical protein